MSYADLSREERLKRNRSNAASCQRYRAKTYEGARIQIRRDGGAGFSLDDVRARAAREGVSLNAWIVQAIKERLERNN